MPVQAAVGSASSEKTLFRRKNTWTWPPSFRWLLAVAVSFADAVLLGVFLVPLLHSGARWGFLVAFVVSWIAMVAFAYRVTRVDPIDQVLLKENADCEDGAELILRCRYCRSNVGVTSKHCFECNKCVSGFDHHCPYLNTCIGDRNYWSFYVTIWAAFAMLGTTVSAAWVLLAQLWMEGGLEVRLYGMGEVQVGALLAAVLLVNTPLLLLDAVLVVLHSYLCIVGLTTYDFLTGKATAKKEMCMQQRKLEGKRSSEMRDATPVAAREDNPTVDSDGEGDASARGAPTPTVSPMQDSILDMQTASCKASGKERFEQQSPTNWLSIRQDDLDVKKSITTAIFGSDVSLVGRPGPSAPPTSV